MHKIQGKKTVKQQQQHYTPVSHLCDVLYWIILQT